MRVGDRGYYKGEKCVVIKRNNYGMSITFNIVLLESGTILKDIDLNEKEQEIKVGDTVYYQGQECVVIRCRGYYKVVCFDVVRLSDGKILYGLRQEDYIVRFHIPNPVKELFKKYGEEMKVGDIVYYQDQKCTIINDGRVCSIPVFDIIRLSDGKIFRSMQEIELIIPGTVGWLRKNLEIYDSDHKVQIGPGLSPTSVLFSNNVVAIS